MPHRSPWPSVDLKLLGTWFACLGVLYFGILVYENYKLIQTQQEEITSLRESVSTLQTQQSELEFVRRSLAAREPYFYLNSLREEWGYRKPGEKYLSELPPRHYITKGVPVYTVSTDGQSKKEWMTGTVFFLVTGLSVIGLTFLLMFSVGLYKRKEPDRVEEIRDRFFSDSSRWSEEPFND
jgi:hypothetical protein